jgi:HAD superfamily hydrolase (TIGR01509 family)
MDGVLWQSSQAHAAAYEQAFAESGIQCLPYEGFAGRRTPEAVAHVLTERGIVPATDTVRALVGRKRELVREVLANHPPIAEDTVPTVRALSGRVPVGLASSASRGSVEIFLNASGLRGCFGVVLCGDDVARAKPDPEIYLAAFAALGVNPANSKVVEDSVSGIAAGLASGATVLGLVGTHPAEELKSAGVRSVLWTLGELVEP